MGTNLSADPQLETKIKRWIDGDRIALVASSDEPPPKKRRSLTQESTNAITISFVYRLGTFHRLVLPGLSTEGLYELVFRAMKGKHNEFALFLNNTQIQANDVTIDKIGIKDQTTIQIRIPDHRTGSPFHQKKRDGDGEMCLVKVYRFDNHCPQFAFWAPKSTDATLSSIIFKYWRSTADSVLSSAHHDFSSWRVWTDMNYRGDGKLTGMPRELWQKLNSYFVPRHAFGRLQNEPVWDERAQGVVPSSSPIVLKVWMGMAPGSRRQGITRLDVLKQMFDQFVNRILAYEYRTHLGLITFNTTAELKLPLTHIVENFRSTVNSLRSSGDTSLWDAIALGSDQLEEYAEKFPKAKKRILCISDGVDNKSDRRVADLCNSLVLKNIIVDSFCLGEEDNRDLRLLCYWTGGYKFHPQTLDQAMAICELEPVLNQLERPPAEIPGSSRAFRRGTNFWIPRNEQMAKPEIVTQDVYPKRKEHPKLQDSFIELATFSNLRGGSNAGAIHESSSRTTRLQNEMKHVLANPHPHYDVYVCESDMSFWKVVMQGSPDSVYAEGTFLLYLHMEEPYPTMGPKGRFVTPIYHPNINRHGRICHSIFDRNWTSDTRCLDVINTVYSLLLVPEFSEPVNVMVTLSYHHDTVAFAEMAKESIKKHAKKSREAWRKDILCLYELRS
jgi:ubiquitin-protein ligase